MMIILVSVFRVVPSVTFTLKKSDINQCPGSPDGEFSGTALCPADLTEVLLLIFNACSPASYFAGQTLFANFQKNHY